MSELNIKIRKLQDNGSTFRATPESLYMGGVGSAKVDALCFDVPEEWKGCAITLHVQRLSGTLPDPQLLDENHCVVVDKRWTKEKQGSWMLLAMNDAGYIAMTKPGQYTCYETIDLNSTTETIPQSLYEQFVAAVLNYANQALASRNAAGEKAEEAKGHADRAEQAKTDAQTAAQQAGESAEKAGQALSDTIAAKDDALKAIDEKQTSAEQIVDIARSRAVSQVRAAGERAKTDVRAAASEAAGSADLASQEAEQAGAAREEAERLRREILSVTTVLPFPLTTADGTTLTTADGETLDAGVRRVRGAKEAEEAAQQAKAARTEAEQAAAATQAERQAAQRSADRAERAAAHAESLLYMNEVLLRLTELAADPLITADGDALETAGGIPLEASVCVIRTAHTLDEAEYLPVSLGLLKQCLGGLTPAPTPGTTTATLGKAVVGRMVLGTT